MIDAAALATLRHAAAHVLVPDVDDPDVDDATAHHIFRVLRLRDGETVTVTDGRGRWRPCRVVAQALEPTGPSHATGARGRLFTVAFAIPKGERPEWIVQKLTELGIDRIVVLHAERSVVRWEADRAHRHIDKLQRVAIEALQQSRGLWLPEIVGPVRRDRRGDGGPGGRTGWPPTRRWRRRRGDRAGGRMVRRRAGDGTSIGSISAPLSYGSRQRLSPERLGW